MQGPCESATQIESVSQIDLQLYLHPVITRFPMETSNSTASLRLDGPNKEITVRRLQFPVLSSTNVWSMDAENRERFDPRCVTLVTASQQTAGKGRFERKWDGGHDCSALMTFVFTLPLNERLYQLSALCAVAVVRALRKHCNFDAGIKWPNDVVFHTSKLAGILVE